MRKLADKPLIEEALEGSEGPGPHQAHDVVAARPGI